VERVHNEELYYLYFSPNIFRLIKSRRLRWTEHVAHVGEKISTYRHLASKREGESTFGRPGSGQKHSIKIGLKNKMTGLGLFGSR
jgi:hypothetical protein